MPSQCELGKNCHFHYIIYTRISEYLIRLPDKVKVAGLLVLGFLLLMSLHRVLQKAWFLLNSHSVVADFPLLGKFKGLCARELLSYSFSFSV